MKQILLLFFSFCIVSFTNAQDIQSLTISPSNPTTSDPITVTAVVDNFPWGNCDASSHSFTQNVWRIDGQAYHQLGGLAVICSSTDYFPIGTYAAGTYWYVHTVTSSSGGMDVDSVQFTVTTTTGIDDHSGMHIANVYPQPASDRLFIDILDNGINNSLFELLDASGRLILSEQINSSTIIHVGELSRGLYFYRVGNAAQHQMGKLILD
ncbi:MAG: T9SS type A sorting domain-containing protein [Bacteroidia bacterium]|nr:T9SS type A sorting domain-containing protein [Bacteroidia bacterium]